MKRYELKNRVIAITGATGGLGKATAQALRDKGARLALLDLDPAALDAQAAALGGPEVAAGWVADVRSFESLEHALQETARHFGGIDVVIANAGIGDIVSMENASLAYFGRVIDVNLTGVWRTFRAALPHVKPRQGYLMAISSMAAFVHSPLNAHYTASKAGVWAMCDSIRLELRHLDVGVGTVHPTFFPTPMMDAVHANQAGNTLWEGNRSGVWKMVTLQEVVQAIVSGIEHRRDMVVVPKSNTLVARAPGLFRPLVEWLGFQRVRTAEAVMQSQRL
jgi:NAD(P)-dependent dehydrogenase (short-subunit alcohol dehydrogenase family)